MQSTTTTAESSAHSHSQWLFPISALSCTPTAQEKSLHEEMYDRARGIEFLYRLGTSIGLFVRLPPVPFPLPFCGLMLKPLSLPSHHPGLFTAATWFHRFFMRYSMLDHHRQVSRCVSSHVALTDHQYVIRPSRPPAYSLLPRQKSAGGNLGMWLGYARQRQRE